MESKERSKLYREQHKDDPVYLAKRAEQKKRYAETHREELRIKDKLFREAHKDDPAYLEKRRATYAKTREVLHGKRLAQAAEYREQHREELREKGQEFRDANKDNKVYKEKRREYDRVFNARHREERNVFAREYKNLHKEEIAKQTKVHRAGPGKAVYKALHHRQHIKSKYGLTPDQLDRLRAAQNNKCAVCGDEFKLVNCSGCARPVYDKTTCCVDHDHKTGMIRGLLCYRCNIGFGQLKEDPARLRAAAAYLAGGRENEPAPIGMTCGICGNEFGDKKSRCMDHDHNTKKIRGELCHGCNLGLGHFRDDARILLAAAVYAERWARKIIPFPIEKTA